MNSARPFLWKTFYSVPSIRNLIFQIFLKKLFCDTCRFSNSCFSLTKGLIWSTKISVKNFTLVEEDSKKLFFIDACIEFMIVRNFQKALVADHSCCWPCWIFFAPEGLLKKLETSFFWRHVVYFSSFLALCWRDCLLMLSGWWNKKKYYICWVAKGFSFFFGRVLVTHVCVSVQTPEHHQ